MPPMRSLQTPATVLGLVLVLAGVVWIAQGLNLPFAPRSFMTSDRSWIVIGAVVALVGTALVWWGRSARARP
ncbi:MAG TPA: hypothetical protein VFV59_08400 [Candidatus Limnocylindria bacterium]|nr:hypothetical protein [Candidatus Limnocylindria bacterium]